MQKILIITGITLVILTAFGIGIWSRPIEKAARIPVAEAQWAPGAIDAGQRIERYAAKFGSGGQLVTKGMAIVNEGQNMQSQAAAAAKGADLVLCANYQARYDRATHTLVSDLNCPLL